MVIVVLIQRIVKDGDSRCRVGGLMESLRFAPAVAPRWPKKACWWHHLVTSAWYLTRAHATVLKTCHGSHALLIGKRMTSLPFCFRYSLNECMGKICMYTCMRDAAPGKRFLGGGSPSAPRLISCRGDLFGGGGDWRL